MSRAEIEAELEIVRRRRAQARDLLQRCLEELDSSRDSIDDLLDLLNEPADVASAR